MDNVLLTYLQQTAEVDSISILMTLLVFITFIVGWVVNRIILLRVRRNSERAKDLSTIMQHTLNIGRNYVLKLSMQDRYAHNMHGEFLPEEGMSYEESLNYIHPDDVQLYRKFLISLVNGAKTAETTIRWDISKEKHEKRWRYMRDSGIAEYANPKLKHPTNLFCTLTDITEQVEMEQQEQEMTNRYKKVFEQGIVGLAFYDKNGHLITANQKMREILKFQSERDPYYYDSTLYDLPTFRDVLYGRKAEELYFCTKSVIIERGVNCYTELRVHPIYDDRNELVHIAFSIRDITQERELYLQSRKNEERIRQQNTAIQQYETELQYLMDNCDMRFWRSSFKDRTVTFYRGLSTPTIKMTFDDFISLFVENKEALVNNFKNANENYGKPSAYLCHMKAIFHDSDEPQWNMIDSVPYCDENGTLIGTYGVIRNVTQLIKKQELLKEETERANQSGLKKSTFMANMTHEIRTPLNAIVGFSDVLPMLTTQEEKQEIVKVIMNNCDMLLRLVNDILAISKLGNGGIDIKPAEVDFAKEFDSMCITLAQRVQTPGVEFIKVNPYERFVTSLDIGRIHQVMTNFVTNAIKYTTQGHIKVGYERQQRQGKNGLYMYCEDTGAGIPKESQAKVFERFVKLNDYVQGTGLGLSICKAIAEGCQGEIGIESEGEGKGSTFWLWIPCEEITTEN